MSIAETSIFPSVALVVVNWNTYGYTKNCLDQAAKLDYPNFEVILVDNGSSDGSGDRIQAEYPHITFLSNDRNLGFTGGNNRGIDVALERGFSYIFLLNNDTYFDPGFLDPLVSHMEMHPGTGAVQPLIYESNGAKGVWHAGGVFNRFTGKTSSIKRTVDLQSPYPSQWLTGCAFLVRSTVVRQIGTLRDAYFAYFEDVDWSFRIKHAGYTLEIVPQAVLHHEVSASTKSKTKLKEGFLSPAAHYLNVRNQFLLLKSEPIGLVKQTAWPYQIVTGLAVLGYFVLRLRIKKLRAAADGLWDGLRDHPKSEIPPDISCYL
ncbi:MAG: glycosyltransferase family 2 protein [Lunatimonas sp.]|uniref:glycosyltransferase family 2 protein n=1 Tax=Lunatimonas sp. TaxID=2060141 RepID=UPI00263A69B5|nr:glycosyltransferase family 2 protein [Lunatimonas sp.]MCC5938450.1 glycosyltransferase family 2 protein [Lunatimonas sp.]